MAIRHSSDANGRRLLLYDGGNLCTAAAPNSLLRRPFVARVTAGDEETIGLSLLFSGLYPVFH